MLIDLSSLSVPMLGGLFVVTALAIVVFGSRLATAADQIADRTGIGEALAGAVLLGAATSLPGIVVSTLTAYFGHPELATSNAIGGIAAQTVFLALADMAYRRANLEHAAASLTNLLQGTLLIVLLAIPIGAMAAPPYAIFGVSPASAIMIGAYVYGVRLSARVQREPMWRPHQTVETRHDQPEEESTRRGRGVWLDFALSAAFAGCAGVILGEAAVELAAKTGLSETAIGTLMTAIATSLPELITAVAAVRRGALQLAVGGIIGGNAFDVLFLASADIAYRDGSIYHVMGDGPVLMTALSMVMTGTLLLGLLARETYGIGRIGFESVTILVAYAAAIVLLF